MTTFMLYTFTDDLTDTISNPKYYDTLKQKLPKQAIIFLLFQEENNLFALSEAQIYSRQSVRIAVWNKETGTISYFNSNLFQRRQNLTGVTITTPNRGALPYFSFEKAREDFDGAHGTLLSLFRKKFNFTLEWFDFSAYGSLTSNGSWTGTVKDLLDEKIDFGEIQKGPPDLAFSTCLCNSLYYNFLIFVTSICIKSLLQQALVT